MKFKTMLIIGGIILLLVIIGFLAFTYIPQLQEIVKSSVPSIPSKAGYGGIV